MRNHIKNYISLLDAEVKHKIQKDFTLDQNFFSDFKTFDFVNFYLTYNYILNDHKNDFFIGIPEDDFRPNFYTAILHSLVLIKLYQNYFTYEKSCLLLNIGDLVCIKRGTEYRTLEVINLTGECARFNYKFPRKNEVGINNFPLKNNNYTKLNPHFVENKNVVKNIQIYREFLDNSFGTQFPFITDFRNKSLVIAEKRFFNESRFLPIRYMTKTGNMNNELPFYSNLIECCNDFESAKKFFFEKGDTFDELIIIGGSKYRECFQNIIQEVKWQGKVKNIILIGADKPNHEFLEWNWSKDEIRIANNEAPKHPIKITIEDSDLLSKLVELKNEIERIKNEHGVNLAFLLKYTNFYCRLLLVDSNLSKGICREYCDRLRSYFKSEKFEEEINQEFYNKDIYNSNVIKSSIDRIFSSFESISILFENRNFKWNYIKENAKRIENKKLYLIADKKSFDAIRIQIRREKVTNIVCISDKRIDNNTDYLDKWINDADKNKEGCLYIVPYLNNNELFDKINLLNGKTEVLCYKDVDEIAFDNLVNQYNNGEKNKLTHKDRNTFIQSIFCMSEECYQRQLDDIFKFDTTDETFKNNPYESMDLPKEKVFYEIEFTDGLTEKHDSSKGIFLVDGKEQIKTTIGEIYEGATIRYYQNDNKEEYRKILKIFDTESLLEVFDTYADSWKLTLKKLSNNYNDIEHLHQEIFDVSYKINLSTFRQYFQDNCETRFPRKKTMEVIRDFCVSKGLSNELIVQEINKFDLYSKRDHAIRQQAGRIIGSDLIDYVASGNRELSESLKKIPDSILQKIVGTIKEKTVNSKKLLEYE